jgi:hypothetical protein
MRSGRFIIIGAVLLVSIVVILIATLAFIPQNANPAFATAVEFTQAAGESNDTAAMALLDARLQEYVRANCPEESVSACVRAYTPPEWGQFRSAVFRRAIPDGAAWDVDLIATYEADKGASGVCIYNRVEQGEDGKWLVTEWAGFVHCAEADSRAMATNPDTPNRAP